MSPILARDAVDRGLFTVVAVAQLGRRFGPVLHAVGGRTVASIKAPERADQVVWDEANRRIYVTGGDGFIGVFEQIDADYYTDMGCIPSAPGAKTAIPRAIAQPPLRRGITRRSADGRRGVALRRNPARHAVRRRS